MQCSYQENVTVYFVVFGWRCHSILVWTLDSRLYDSSSNPTHCSALFVLQQDTFSTLLLSTQVYKWVPGRMPKLFVAWFGMWAPLKWHLARMLPRELRWCTLSAGLILNPVTGVIIHCKALCVVFHTRKALYKNQFILLSLLLFHLWQSCGWIQERFPFNKWPVYKLCIYANHFQIFKLSHMIGIKALNLAQLTLLTFMPGMWTKCVIHWWEAVSIHVWNTDCVLISCVNVLYWQTKEEYVQWVQTMVPLHKICDWTQVRKIKHKSLMHDSDWLKLNLRFDFSDLRSNTHFMQRGQYEGIRELCLQRQGWW